VADSLEILYFFAIPPKSCVSGIVGGAMEALLAQPGDPDSGGGEVHFMATKFVPNIAEEDYQSFRSMLHGSIPDSYYDWLNLAFEMKTESIGEGNFAAAVEVNPDEFARYCRSTENLSNLYSLKQFAHAKGIGNAY
jgi:hypothetical protein